MDEKHEEAVRESSPHKSMTVEDVFTLCANGVRNTAGKCAAGVEKFVEQGGRLCGKAVEKVCGGMVWAVEEMCGEERADECAEAVEKMCFVCAAPCVLPVYLVHIAVEKVCGGVPPPPPVAVQQESSCCSVGDGGGSSGGGGGAMISAGGGGSTGEAEIHG